MNWRVGATDEEDKLREGLACHRCWNRPSCLVTKGSDRGFQRRCRYKQTSWCHRGCDEPGSGRADGVRKSDRPLCAAVPVPCKCQEQFLPRSGDPATVRVLPPHTHARSLAHHTHSPTAERSAAQAMLRPFLGYKSGLGRAGGAALGLRDTRHLVWHL